MSYDQSAYGDIHEHNEIHNNQHVFCFKAALLHLFYKLRSTKLWRYTGMQLQCKYSQQYDMSLTPNTGNMLRFLRRSVGLWQENSHWKLFLCIYLVWDHRRQVSHPSWFFMWMFFKTGTTGVDQKRTHIITYSYGLSWFPYY